MKSKRVQIIGMVLALAVLLTAAMPALAAAAGTGPDDAVSPSGEWQALHKGDVHWFSFYYAGDGSQITVRLGVEPEGGAAFSVWTPSEMRKWGDGAEVEPIGRSSTDPGPGTGLVWTGSFQEADTYYVTVEHSGSQPGQSFYSLAVEGTGVSMKAAPAEETGAGEASTGTVETREPSSASVEPSGKLVFQTSMGGDIYTIDLNGQGLSRAGDGMDPSWSPGGDQIAFIRWEEPRGVWVMDADGSGARRVFDESEPRWTSWSPDGDEILFSRVNGGRVEAREFCFRGMCFTFPATPHWALSVVSKIDGSFYEPAPPDSQTSRAPSWSPDGEKVVFADVQGLRVQTLDGSISYQITNDAKDTSPVWSPDGSQVAFVRRQHDHWELYVVDADGQNLQRLTTTPSRPDGQPSSSASPAWSPDGGYLAFLTDRRGEWEMWMMAANGQGQAPIFDSALDDLRLEYASMGERAISWTW